MFFAGCSQAADYHIQMTNLGEYKITEATIVYKDASGFGFRFGTIVPNTKAGHSFVPAPIPESVEITWKDHAGKSHRAELEVKKHVPSEFEGTISFEIDGNNQATMKVLSGK
jgi:hypothetical protein